MEKHLLKNKKEVEPLTVRGLKVETDEDGHLANLYDWDKYCAEKIARDLGVKLNDDYWEIFSRLRKFAQMGTPITTSNAKVSFGLSRDEFKKKFKSTDFQMMLKLAGLPKMKK